MINLKAGWCRVKFGDVVRLGKESCKYPEAEGIKRYIGLEHITPNDLRIRSWGNVTEGTTFTRRCRPGQVLFGKRRAYQRKVAICEFDAVCSGDIYVFESKDPQQLLPDLLPFICQTDSFFEFAVGTSAGSLSPRTNWKSLEEFEFVIPPLEEQQRIVRLLKISWETVEAVHNALDKVRTMEFSTIDEWVKSWFKKYDSVRLRETFQFSPESGCSAPPTNDPTGYWVLSLSALKEWGYSPGEFKSVLPSEKMRDAVLNTGDLLISRSNTRDRVGFVGVFDECHDEPISYPDTMMRLHPREDVFEKRALELILRSSPLRRQIMSSAAGTSASMKKINRKTLGALKLPTPPIDIQRKALSILAELRVAASRCTIRVKQQTQMHQQLLAFAIGGEL